MFNAIDFSYYNIDDIIFWNLYLLWIISLSLIELIVYDFH